MNSRCRCDLSRRGLLALLGAAPGWAQTPYKPKPQVPLPYESPSPRALECVQPRELRIGFFGPDQPSHPRGGTLWMGAALAVEDANAAGGFRGAPIRVIPRWSDDPWRAGASAIVRLAYDEHICALVGGVDSDTTHLATQIAAKALFPVIDPVSTDETANHAGVPWIFSWAPGNRQIARQMQDLLSESPFLLVSGTDHDSRMLTAAFLKEGPRQPVLRIDTSGLAHPAVPRDADQVVVIAPPACTIACAESFPHHTRMVAGPAASSRRCIHLAGRVRTPALLKPDSSLWKRLESRFDAPADAFAQLSFEATSALIQVIQEVGPSRAALREALASRMPPGGRRQFVTPNTIEKEL
ncbi:MAG: ABC transporter substrate-binding protein [Bryobacterales bacterium]|nr:ABC transporter substrate-binding protein [Bryobacterales bacterium]